MLNWKRDPESQQRKLWATAQMSICFTTDAFNSIRKEGQEEKKMSRTKQGSTVRTVSGLQTFKSQKQVHSGNR